MKMVVNWQKLLRTLGIRTQNDSSGLAKKEFEKKMRQAVFLSLCIFLACELLTTLAIGFRDIEKLGEPLSLFESTVSRWKNSASGGISDLVSLLSLMATLVVAVVFAGRFNKSINPLTRVGVEWLHSITYLVGVAVGAYSISIFASTVSSGTWESAKFLVVIIGAGSVAMGVISNLSEFQLESNDVALRRYLPEAERNQRLAQRFHTVATRGGLRSSTGVAACIVYFISTYSIFPAITFWMSLSWGIIVSIVMFSLQAIWLGMLLSVLNDHPYWTRRPLVSYRITLSILGATLAIGSFLLLLSLPLSAFNTNYIIYISCYSVATVWGAWWFGSHWMMTRVAVHKKWKIRYEESVLRAKQSIIQNRLLKMESLNKSCDGYSRPDQINYSYRAAQRHRR